MTSLRSRAAFLSIALALSAQPALAEPVLPSAMLDDFLQAVVEGRTPGLRERLETLIKPGPAAGSGSASKPAAPTPPASPQMPVAQPLALRPSSGDPGQTVTTPFDWVQERTDLGAAIDRAGLGQQIGIAGVTAAPILLAVEPTYAPDVH